jgi:hypothetical protein
MYLFRNQNVLIEVNPRIRIPRTFKRFCGLMGLCSVSMFPTVVLSFDFLPYLVQSNYCTN